DSPGWDMTMILAPADRVQVRSLAIRAYCVSTTKETTRLARWRLSIAETKHRVFSLPVPQGTIDPGRSLLFTADMKRSVPGRRSRTHRARLHRLLVTAPYGWGEGERQRFPVSNSAIGPSEMPCSPARRTGFC